MSVLRDRRLVTLLAALACAALLLWFTPGAWGAPPDREIDESPDGIPYVAGELLVTYEEGASGQESDAVVQDVGARTEKKIPAVETRLISLPEIKDENEQEAREQDLEREKQALQNKPAVEEVDYNYIVEASFTPNDPGFRNQYGLTKIRSQKAWNYSRGGGVKIAVIDSGIDADHPDIRGKIAAQKDFVDDALPAQDQTGHGTHVAGIAAANTNNRAGVAGGCPACKILVARVLGPDGSGTVADVIDGITWSADNGAKVINLSLGHYGEAVEAEENAVNYARNKGAMIVGAAGNGATSERFYPGAYTRAMAVSATDQNDRRAGFSNFGDWVDVAAPGVRILSTVPGSYGYKSGTSMSTPYVSGLAALISAQGYSADQVRNRIEATATDLNPRGKDPFFGHGRIDAYRAAYRPYTQIVDNSSNRFSASGAWGTSSWNRQKTGKDYRVTRPARRVVDPAKFKVKIPTTGRYEIYARWPAYSRFNDRTRFLVRTTDGWKTETVNQRKNGGWWVSLGSYNMQAGDGDYVRITRRTGGSGYIIADAVLVKRR